MTDDAKKKRHSVPHIMTAAPVDPYVGVVPSSPKARTWEPPYTHIQVIDFLSVSTEPVDDGNWAVTVVLDNEKDAELFHNAIAGKLVRLAGDPVTDVNGAPVIDANTGRQKMRNVRRVAIDDSTNHPHLDPVSGHAMTVVPPLEPVAEADAVMPEGYVDDDDDNDDESESVAEAGGAPVAAPRKTKAEKAAEKASAGS